MNADLSITKRLSFLDRERNPLACTAADVQSLHTLTNKVFDDWFDLIQIQTAIVTQRRERRGDKTIQHRCVP